jgi:DNA invertase Pin-like site-specific DNA recombinase
MTSQTCAAPAAAASTSSTSLRAPASATTFGKITPEHLARQAYVYVRQSTPHQVRENTESQRLQYQLAERAAALGWARERVSIIDADLGHSGAEAASRPGFQALVAEVSLGRAGIVLALEASRLARNGRDWHQLLELCGLFGTLLADSEGVYDPRTYNDRLLLGLKGTLSEAELYFLRQRMDAGRLEKARRGELLVALPSGYVRGEDGRALVDPDASVQAAIRLVFEQLGTAQKVVPPGGCGSSPWCAGSAASASPAVHPLSSGARRAFGCRRFSACEVPDAPGDCRSCAGCGGGWNGSPLGVAAPQASARAALASTSRRTPSDSPRERGT